VLRPAPAEGACPAGAGGACPAGAGAVPCGAGCCAVPTIPSVTAAAAALRRRENMGVCLDEEV
jgi:hypothetical protein